MHHVELLALAGSLVVLISNFSQIVENLRELLKQLRLTFQELKKWKRQRRKVVQMPTPTNPKKPSGSHRKAA